jgi:hypothetical protein
MKRFLPVLLFVAVLLSGCSGDETTILNPEDLAPPLGLKSITGHQQVTLFWWCSNFEDLDGYKVYSREGDHAGDPDDEIPVGFEVIDSVEVASPCGDQRSIVIAGLTNGTTYSFLVVAARDDWHEISNTSNIVADTPRPESAAEVRIYAKQVRPADGAIELSNFDVVDVTDLNTNDYSTADGEGDVMAERFNPGAGPRMWLDGINEGTIQDIGYMADWDDADKAPASGYAETGHSIEALMGHVYAVHTGENHYAKLQVTGIDVTEGWVEVKAAYQTAIGDIEYK